ncbi:coiled-coil domain-containing protein 180 isoform X3 [Pezoporus wallicus]|uniref:coiled-coil domain-containing protein 180 isoform X3 n=1 Tax=Pezoporus wallicus TaxID=35540 RepID=UPI00254F5068|nr:coiled-coil domain-containing protein 180 isoform X3 [Pezoporus wallicus]XP_061332813.1 coiled-coil domain-containing protein 180 isoform X3 [Pezoporus flaviventris]
MDSEIPTDAKLLQRYQQQGAERAAYNASTQEPPLYREATIFQKACRSVSLDASEEVRSLPHFIVPEEMRSNILERLSEHRRGRHDEALTSMYHELTCIAREMEPFVLEPGKFLLTKLMESDRKIEHLFKKIEFATTLEGFSIEGLEELWSIIHQESLTRRKWIKKMDESLKKVERSRADQITAVLRKYTVILENISFCLSADVYRLINNEAMLINRALLANQRAIAKLFCNLMKSELKKELFHRLKWQDRVKDWKLIQKNCIVHSFREFMANEEIQNPPSVKKEMENMITDQILLGERRLEFLQHLGDLLPPTHTKAEISEWYRSLVNLNKSIDTYNVQYMRKIRIQYERVQQTCLAAMQLHKNNLLSLNICTKEEAEETVNCDFLQLTEKLENRFEEELEHMDRDFEELAKQHDQNCEDLYNYFQEAMGLWDVHQLKLSQREDQLQKKLDECRREHDNLTQMLEANLDIILDKMRRESSKENLKKYLENAFSSLDDIRARYETFNQVLMDKIMAYPEAIFQELISYSISISQYFNVKEIFKQNLQGKTDSALQDEELVKASEAECLVEQQAESSVQENEGEEKIYSCQQENEETHTAENEEVFAQETEKKENNEDEESFPHESKETEHAEQEVMFNSSKAESSEIATEVFSTSSGNSYTVLRVEEAGKTGIPETYFTKYEQKESLPVYLKYILIEETVFVELKKRIRLCFFEHLEKWFAESLSNSCVFVAAKKEELNSELQLCLHLHQQKQENIETNIYNVRAVELLLHKERLECHCRGVGEALEKERAEFLGFCEQQDNICKNLESHLRDMESVFLSAPMTEKFVSFSNNLHSELHNHLEMIQVSLRSYRNYLEEAFGKLRNSNVDFLKTCRLFLEGGNFSPEEVKSFSKRLQEESEHIDAFEGLIKTDMEKMESSCLEQATELINQSEMKFCYLFMSRVFMEKIQQFLTNLRVRIKSEVADSNLQAVTLNSYLEKLRQKIDACAHPTADTEALTSEELYDFAKVVLKELKKRSQYLDCLLVKAISLHDNEDFSPPAADVTLQGPIAVATRTGYLRDENKVMVMGLDPVKFPLLNPSRMGKPTVDDLAISVIKNLLEIQPYRRSSGLNQDHSLSSGAVILPTSKKSSCLNVSDEDPRKSASCSSAALTTRKASPRKLIRTGRIQKYTRPVLSDKEFQIFEEKPPESDTFKKIIMNILWTGNNSLLCLAEEFYQKGKPQVTKITVPEDLPETFEHCAEVLRQKLLSYQSQTDDYYNFCLIEFQDQLKLFEKELAYVSLLAVDSLFKEHEQKLSYSTGQVRLLFNKQLEDWENLKAAHKNQLRPSLGHPGNLLQLDSLCQEELKRQKEQADGIHLNMQMLQDCAAECAQNFVSALAAFTEKLLLELDESVTADDVQVPKIETPREKTSTLMHRKQAGFPLEICEVKQITDRGSRTWPGIPMTTLADNADYVLCRETASVTTAKTTLGHVAAVEARDTVYKGLCFTLWEPLLPCEQKRD